MRVKLVPVFRFRKVRSNDIVQIMRRALVLSGGGLWGAWQAGAWSVLADAFEPDLIVGASIGSLNGYMIASGVSPAALIEQWSDAGYRDHRRLHENLRMLTERCQLKKPFALTVTETLRMKPRIYQNGEITWKHLAASCAVPVVLPQVKLDGRWLSDGGLLGPLPVWAAVELGATEIVGLNVLGKFPLRLVGPFVGAFRATFAPRKVIPADVRVWERQPSRMLGGMKSTFFGSQTEVRSWIELGAEDTRKWLEEKPFPL